MKKILFIPIFVMITISKMIPFNWIVGSYRLMFSCTSIMAPVIGNQFGLSWVSFFFLSKNIFSVSFLFLHFTHRLPLFFAALAYKQKHWTTSFLVPMACIIFFVTNDVGSVAWVYSLYWFIPMFLFFVKNSLLSRALTSSFVAHAVGSVVWLYTANISAPVWIALIPVVFCERLLIAGAIFGVDVLISRVRSACHFNSFLKKVGLA